MDGFEPSTHRVTAGRSAAELHQIEAAREGFEPSSSWLRTRHLAVRPPRIEDREAGLEPAPVGSKPTVLPLHAFPSRRTTLAYQVDRWSGGPPGASTTPGGLAMPVPR